MVSSWRADTFSCQSVGRERSGESMEAGSAAEGEGGDVRDIG